MFLILGSDKQIFTTSKEVVEFANFYDFQIVVSSMHALEQNQCFQLCSHLQKLQL